MQANNNRSNAAKENHISSARVSGMNSTQNILAQDAAIRMQAVAALAAADAAAEVGEDALEEGLGEEQVLVAEGATEGAAEGLFGGMAAGAATLGPVGAVAGLAAAGAAGSKDVNAEDPVIGTEAVITAAKANSAGVNIGPSEDGSLLVSGGKTDVALLGSTTPNLSLNKLSVLNPDAPLPSGNPLSIDAATQTVGVNLGPLLQTELDLSLDTIADTAVNFVLGIPSFNIELTELAKLNIPTSIGGMDIPLVASLNDGLAQLDAALDPVLEGLQSALGGPGATEALSALDSIPVISDITGQISSLIAGGLPTGSLPIPTDILPTLDTGTPLDIVLDQLPAAVDSLNAGQIPLAGLLTELIPGTAALPVGGSGGGAPSLAVPETGTPLDMVTGLLSGGLPSGGLPTAGLPTGGATIPETGTPLDLLTSQLTSAIGSLPSPDSLPLALPA